MSETTSEEKMNSTNETTTEEQMSKTTTEKKMNSRSPTLTALVAGCPHLEDVFVGGSWVQPSSRGTHCVVMPSTGETVATVAMPGATEADAAAEAARRAFDNGSWSDLASEDRIATCRRFTAALEARSEQLSLMWTIESGFPITQSRMTNAVGSPVIWNAALERASEIVWEERRTRFGSDVLVRREPIGVVLGIVPYNGPLPALGAKIIPALLAGNTVVMKTAPDSQLTSRVIADAAAEAGFPPGVFSVLAGDLENAQHLVGHRDVDMVSMTGSVVAAVDVVTRTAPRVARTALELGGKSAAIVLGDADLDEVIPTLVPAGIGGAGQVCVALTRILVPRVSYEDAVARLAAEFAKYKPGDPFDDDTVLGPLGNERALQRVESMLARAVEDGAKIAAGGHRSAEFDGKGFYFEPTLLRDVDENSFIAQEEVFGPIICVLPYGDEDDAIRIANNSKYGLAGAVYSRDPEHAAAVARRIRTGIVGINRGGVCLTEPYGGVKMSGWGRETGAEGILGFTDIKQILLSVNDGLPDEPN
jgi:acyl-CoA reductase-like NAD-dependent aldehyde dehydrogenase